MDKKHSKKSDKKLPPVLIRESDERDKKGQVISFYGGHALVESTEGSLILCALRQNLPILVPGDWVLWQSDSLEENTGVIVEHEQRTQELARPRWDGSLKVMAANVSQMCVVFAPCPIPDETLLDSYCVAAEHTGIRPLLILNKADLLTEDMPWKARLAEYEQIGYKTLTVSTRSTEGLEALTNCLQNEVTIFAGPSGVGKSSLIQTLIPELTLETNVLKQGRYGKHTTSRGHLYHLPHGGSVIDSPGIRQFGLWHLNPSELAWGFIEFRPYIGHCQFRDCSHQHEPKCALIEAVQKEQIIARRLQAFQKMAAMHLK